MPTEVVVLYIHFLEHLLLPRFSVKYSAVLFSRLIMAPEFLQYRI